MSSIRKATHEMVLQLPEQFRFTRGDASRSADMKGKYTSENARRECLAELVPWAESFLNQSGNEGNRVLVYRFVSHILQQLGETSPQSRGFTDGEGI